MHLPEWSARDLGTDGGVWAGVCGWCSWACECGNAPYNAVKSSADEPLVLHFLPPTLSPFTPIRCPWWSSSSPDTPSRFPTPTRLGRRSSIIDFWGHALKLSCRLKMAGKMLNCWWEDRSSGTMEVAGAADAVPSDPALLPMPLKSNLRLLPYTPKQFIQNGSQRNCPKVITKPRTKSSLHTSCKWELSLVCKPTDGFSWMCWLCLSFSNGLWHHFCSIITRNYSRWPSSVKFSDWFVDEDTLKMADYLKT